MGQPRTDGPGSALLPERVAHFEVFGAVLGECLIS